MIDSDTTLIDEIKTYQEGFEIITNKLIKTIQRQDKIMYRSDKRQKDEYDQLQQKLIEIQTLQEEIVNTQKEVIFTMGAIGETRSKETGNHVKRVAQYSYVFAIKYGLSIDDAELLRQASPMHDIGKVGIPDNILNKPGRHTKEEFELMKTHANIGYEMLKSSTRPILKTAAIVAHEHHERIDGKVIH